MKTGRTIGHVFAASRTAAAAAAKRVSGSVALDAHTHALRLALGSPLTARVPIFVQVLQARKVERQAWPATAACAHRSAWHPDAPRASPPWKGSTRAKVVVTDNGALPEFTTTICCSSVGVTSKTSLC